MRKLVQENCVIALPPDRPDAGSNFVNEAAYNRMRDGEVLFVDFPQVYFYAERALSSG